MVTRAAAAAVALAAAWAASGCGEEEGVLTAVPVEEEGEAVEILRSLPASTSGGIRTPLRTVVRDPVLWAELWAKANAHVAPIPKAPAVDFAKEMAALAALGEKPSAGWSIQIVGVRAADGKLRLLVAERSPPKGSAAAAVITDPWHAVVLPRSDLPVEWVPYEAPSKK